MTYKDLFGNYLRTVKEICITAPFIRQPYQIDNLVDFIQMVKDVSTQQDTIKIHLSTQNDDDEKVAEVIDSFNDLVNELLPMGIEFTYDFKADHDRLIKTDTGGGLSHWGVAWISTRSSTVSHCAVPIKRTGVARLLMFQLTKLKIKI